MKEFINYIEDACKDVKQSDILYSFKKKTLDEMNDRACDVRQAGLSNNKVIADLIISEYPDIKDGYGVYFTKEKTKRKEAIQHKLLALGTPLMILLSVALYVIQGILLGTWGNGRWLIIVGTVFFMSSLCCLAAIRQILRRKRIFHIFARLLTAAIIMQAAVFIFLWCGVNFGWALTWPIIPGGVAALLLGDLLFAFKTRQKLVALNVFVYTPAVFAMLYVVLAAFNIVSWGNGWALIFLGFAADAIFGLAVLIDNAKFKNNEEIEDIWKEN